MSKEPRNFIVNLGWPVIYHPKGDLNAKAAMALVVAIGRDCLCLNVQSKGGMYNKDGVLFAGDPRVPLDPQGKDANGLWSFVPDFPYPVAHTPSPYPARNEKKADKIGPVPVARDMFKAAEMRAYGQSIAQIASAMNCSHSQVQRMLETAETSPTKPKEVDKPVPESAPAIA
jgi:hypothetical protein